MDKLIHTSNYFYNEPSALASEKFIKASGMTKVFYTNSGAEAVEGALKLAKKYGRDRMLTFFPTQDNLPNLTKNQ